MSTGQRIAKNFFLQALAYLFKAASTFITYILIARLAGAQVLGNFVTVITIVAFFTFLSAFGIPELLTRELARLRGDPEQAKKLINASLGLVIIFSIPTIILLTLLGKLLYYPTNILIALIVGGFGLIFESMANVVSASFRSVEEMGWTSSASIIMEILFLIALFVLIKLSSALVWLMCAYIISRLAYFLTTVKFYRIRFGKLHPVFDRKLCNQIIRMSFPFSANEVLSLVYVRIDIIFLSIFTTGAMVGIYEAATSLTIRISLLARMLNFALYPFLASQFGKNPVSIRAYTSKSIQYLFIPGFLISLILLVFPKAILGLLYGNNFLGGAIALQLMALIIPLRLLDNTLATTLTATNRQGKRTIAIAVSAVINLLLSLTLIPPYKIMGAVFETIITEIFLASILIWFLRREIAEYISWRTFLAPGVGSILFILITLIPIANVWFLCASASLTYCFAVALLDRSSVKLTQKLLFPQAS